MFYDHPWTLDYDTANCTIGAAIGLIGEKWTFLVLREAFTGVRRFADMQRRTQAPRQILSDRLSRLVGEGIRAGPPIRRRASAAGMSTGSRTRAGTSTWS